jgi:hypothetical protein
MKMDRLQGTKLDWYVKDMHRLKESTLKRHFPQFPEWKQSICVYLKHAPKVLKCIRWTLNHLF